MKYIKTIIELLWIVVFLIIAIPAMLCMLVLYKKDPVKTERIARYWITIYMNGALALSGTRPVIKGLENVPEDTSVLYVANHRSYFDIVVTYPLSKKPTSFVAKAELQNIPFFAFWGRNMQCLFFDKNDMKASMKMILEGISRLKNGISVFICPEGGRNHSKEMLPLQEFRDGSFKLASKSGCPVIPVAIYRMDDIWEAQTPWIKKAYPVVTYGKPVYIKDLSPEDQKRPGEYFKNLIEDMLRETEESLEIAKKDRAWK